MRRYISAALFAVSALGLALPALTQASQKTGAPLEVAFYEAGHLYSNGVGIDKDVIDEIQRRGSYSFNGVELPRVRIWASLEEGTLPMSVSGIQNAERDKFAYFIPYIAQKNMALIANKAYTTPDALLADKKAKVAVVRGFKHGSYFDGLIDKMRANGGVTEVSSIKNLFAMLQSGDRVDMVVSLPVFYAKELKDLKIDSSVAVYDWDGESKPITHSLILAKSHFSEADYESMKGIVVGMRADGTLERIFAKYLSAKDAEDALNY